MITESEYLKAKKVVDSACNADDYVVKNIEYFMFGGEPSDNSISLFDYYNDCKKIVRVFEKKKGKK